MRYKIRYTAVPGPKAQNIGSITKEWTDAAIFYYSTIDSATPEELEERLSGIAARAETLVSPLAALRQGRKGVTYSTLGFRLIPIVEAYTPEVDLGSQTQMFEAAPPNAKQGDLDLQLTQLRESLPHRFPQAYTFAKQVCRGCGEYVYGPLQKGRDHRSDGNLHRYFPADIVNTRTIYAPNEYRCVPCGGILLNRIEGDPLIMQCPSCGYMTYLINDQLKSS